VICTAFQLSYLLIVKSGYQCSYGCSMAAVEIVKDVLQDSSMVVKEEMADFGKAKL